LKEHFWWYYKSTILRALFLFRLSAGPVGGLKFGTSLQYEDKSRYQHS